MEVLVKKQLFVFLLTGIGFGGGFLNSMDINHDDNNDLYVPAPVAPPAVPVALAAPAPAAPFGRGAGPAFAPGFAPLAGVAAPGAVAHNNNQRMIIIILKNLLVAPWKLGSKITSFINSSTANIEPASQVAMRCFLEGAFCGILLYLVSGNALGNAANKRWNLASFAWEDVMSRTPFHYTASRLWIAISGLQHLGVFLGLTGLRLYGWFFGVIIGFRCAYDSFIKLPISFLAGDSHTRRRGMGYPFRFGLDD
jgi:hypothetical protein